MNLLKSLLVFIFSILPFVAFGQTINTSKTESEMTTSWLVTVVGEKRTRTLTIRGMSQKESGVYTLDALYGMTDQGVGPVKGELIESALERKLLVTTQADTKLVATQQSDGTFAGTFTLKNGVVKNITMVNLSDKETQAKAESEKSAALARIFKRPSSDVPPACAAFFGRWGGTWNMSSDALFLNITEISAKCVVKYSFWNTPVIITNLKTAEINDRILSFPCSVGTCEFRRSGENMQVDFYSSTFQKGAMLKKFE